ncbi:hypothetical protein LguiA_018476 [Lonicera macranthoides]
MAVASFQKHFQAQDTDILVATVVKSGTTWLKAITFSIMNRPKYSYTENPLLTTNPHVLVPNLELELYSRDENSNINDLPFPRLLSTHVPYNSLPHSILNSKYRIVYICRNPLDQFVSYWHFLISVIKSLHIEDKVESPSLDETFELFCRGEHSFGPFWEHALGYWRASIECPNMKIAEFLGFPFSLEEENEGVIEEIANMCSFKNLKNLDVNKFGRHNPFYENSSYFRNGQVGDWANYLSPSQAERLKKIAKEKLGDSEQADFISSLCLVSEAAEWDCDLCGISVSLSAFAVCFSPSPKNSIGYPNLLSRGFFSKETSKYLIGSIGRSFTKTRKIGSMILLRRNK